MPPTSFLVNQKNLPPSLSTMVTTVAEVLRLTARSAVVTETGMVSLASEIRSSTTTIIMQSACAWFPGVNVTSVFIPI